MKSSYYDLLDKYFGEFCGDGDAVDVVDEKQNRVHCTVRSCTITCVSVEDENHQSWTVPRTSIVSIKHNIQQKSHVAVEVNDLVSFSPGEDREIRCLGVVLRQNPPCALIRVLTGQQTSETINVWLKKLQFVARGFSLG
ncbi:hypothetical protein WA577_007577, partial [Blastocystis sp. JDR]